MDFASLMAQIHASDLDETSVEDLIAMSSVVSEEEQDFNDSMMNIPGIDTPALRDFMVDYLDMMAVGGVGGASYNLVEVDNLTGFQLLSLANEWGVDVEKFRK